MTHTLTTTTNTLTTATTNTLTTTTNTLTTVAGSHFGRRSLASTSSSLGRTYFPFRQALTSLCSSSRATSTPASLLAACLDPPAAGRLCDALDALVTMRAARVGEAAHAQQQLLRRQAGSSGQAAAVSLAAPGAVEVTAVGRLLDSLPISLEVRAKHDASCFVFIVVITCARSLSLSLSWVPSLIHASAHREP